MTAQDGTTTVANSVFAAVDTRSEWPKARVNLAMAYLADGRKPPALVEFRRAVALGEASPLALINLALLTLQLETVVQKDIERKADQAPGLDRKTLEIVLGQLRAAEKQGSGLPELNHCIGCVIHALANTYMAVVKHDRPDPLSLTCRYERRLMMTPEQTRGHRARSSMPLSREACDELFDQIDVDGDGALTKKEIKKGLEAIKAATGELKLSKAAAKMFQVSRPTPNKRSRAQRVLFVSVLFYFFTQTKNKISSKFAILGPKVLETPRLLYLQNTQEQRLGTAFGHGASHEHAPFVRHTIHSDDRRSK